MQENQSHRKRKPTKKEMQQKVVDTFQSELKKNYIKALIQGQEIFAKTILDYINNGKSLDEIKSFCEIALHNSQKIEEISTNKNKKGE